MKPLLLEINEQADNVVAENAIIDHNLTLLSEYLSLSAEQLNEAVTSWLAKIRGLSAAGKFAGKMGRGATGIPAEKKDAVAKILGALDAITNPDLADALDEKGDLGSILLKVSSENKDESNAALHRLLGIGNHPSVKSFVENAQKVMQSIEVRNNTQPFEALTKKIQAKIEPIMNKKVATERRKA